MIIILKTDVDLSIILLANINYFNINSPLYNNQTITYITLQYNPYKYNMLYRPHVVYYILYSNISYYLKLVLVFSMYCVIYIIYLLQLVIDRAFSSKIIIKIIIKFKMAT